MLWLVLGERNLLESSILEYNIVSQAGSFYAIYLIESLGLKGEGGVVRIGFTHYNTIEEIERVVKALDELARSQ